MANAPRCSVGPSTANNAAAKNAARRPNSRPAVPHSNAVAPSMNTSDRTRRPGQPAHAVGQRAQRRVEHRRPREVRRERRNRRAVQPVRPLQMPRPQGRGLVSHTPCPPAPAAPTAPPARQARPAAASHPTLAATATTRPAVPLPRSSGPRFGLMYRPRQPRVPQLGANRTLPGPAALGRMSPGPAAAGHAHRGTAPRSSATPESAATSRVRNAAPPAIGLSSLRRINWSHPFQRLRTVPGRSQPHRHSRWWSPAHRRISRET